ncbi:hypothetical protein ACVBEF_18740 [Glaciimonas sp. GG7]
MKNIKSSLYIIALLSLVGTSTAHAQSCTLSNNIYAAEEAVENNVNKMLKDVGLPTFPVTVVC